MFVESCLFWCLPESFSGMRYALQQSGCLRQRALPLLLQGQHCQERQACFIPTEVPQTDGWRTSAGSGEGRALPAVQCGGQGLMRGTASVASDGADGPKPHLTGEPASSWERGKERLAMY